MIATSINSLNNNYIFIRHIYLIQEIDKAPPGKSNTNFSMNAQRKFFKTDNTRAIV